METTLSAIAQRAAYAALPMTSPGFALAQRWCRIGFRLDRRAFEERAMGRLRRLVGSSVEQRGLGYAREGRVLELNQETGFTHIGM